ncbi:MAG: hypothetical protein GXY74_03085 [Phycisphaerae bacterium]|nr:hypothetical protein [Phycisphaerae bacterium]
MRWSRVTTVLALWVCGACAALGADAPAADRAETSASPAAATAPATDKAPGPQNAQATPAADTKATEPADKTTAPDKTPSADAAPATAEAGKAPAAEPVIACKVTSVTRTVRWRSSGEAVWQDMKVDDRLPLGADICTGLRAGCRLEFNDASSVVDVQPMTIVRIGEFETVGDKVRTRLYLKQGTVQADVEKARFQSDFAIVSPEVTLAVQGTNGIEFKHFGDTGAHCSLLKRGLLLATQNAGGRSRFLRPGDSVASGTNFQPPIRMVLLKKLVQTYDQRGTTPHEILSIVNRPQIFTGPPGGSAPGPGGQGNAGDLGRRLGGRAEGLRQFFKNHPELLPGGSPLAPPAPVVDDHGGSGM